MVMQAQGTVIYSAPRCGNYFTTLCGGLQCHCDTARCGAAGLVAGRVGDSEPRKTDLTHTVGPIRLAQA
jgi:hypothetical protein